MPPRQLVRIPERNQTIMSFRLFLCRWAILLALPGSVGGVLAQDFGIGCGSLENGYGPYDYRATSPQGRALVEKFHFTPTVERGLGGSTAISAGGDLNYTLRVFPNHPRALLSLIRLAEKEKRDPPRGMEYSVACWFDRAERFRSDDAMVIALHGIYLIRAGKASEGAERLKVALDTAGDNANIHYNLGLAYFELKQYDKALASAQKAYAMGFPLPGLRNMLKRVGHWTDPVPVEAPPLGVGVPMSDAATPPEASGTQPELKAEAVPVDKR